MGKELILIGIVALLLSGAIGLGYVPGFQAIGDWQNQPATLSVFVKDFDLLGRTDNPFIPGAVVRVFSSATPITMSADEVKALGPGAAVATGTSGADGKVELALTTGKYYVLRIEKDGYFCNVGSVQPLFNSMDFSQTCRKNEVMDSPIANQDPSKQYDVSGGQVTRADDQGVTVNNQTHSAVYISNTYITNDVPLISKKTIDLNDKCDGSDAIKCITNNKIALLLALAGSVLVILGLWR